MFLRAHGTYSVKITNPLLFYAEAVPKNTDHVEIDEINEQYLSEFLEALQSAINQMSADGIRISFVSSKARELGQYMANILDEEWNQMRGMEVQAVGISISYNEDSQKLINLRNEGAMLSDPTIREGYVQAAAARGLEAAGSNANGAMAGFMGMGMTLQGGAAGFGATQNFYNAGVQQDMAAQQAAPQPQAPAAGSGASDSWTCTCGTTVTGKFCPECGTKKPEPAPSNAWKCSCGTMDRPAGW